MRKIRLHRTTTDTKKRRNVCLWDSIDPAVLAYALVANLQSTLIEADRVDVLKSD
jgi:hypothetical protein